MAKIEIKNVEKNYGTSKVLEQISVSVNDGEFLALVGPSGCGKSTLLRMLAGLEDITTGEILIDDKVVNDIPPKQRDVSMVFQNYALYPHLNVAENMAFSLTLAGASKTEKAARVSEAAEILGLTELLNRKPKNLSGGQRQRVAMGRAIIRRPKVFLFDEPLSNLDAKLRVAMRAEIKALHQKLKTTAIYVTHDQIEAMTMADRVVVLNEGRIEQVGRPLELYDNPINKFVAGFIGTPSMNLIDGQIDLSARIPYAVFKSGEKLALPLHSSLQDGDKSIYGIRPENCKVSGSGVPAKVELVEPMGAETQILVRLNEQKFIISIHERLHVSPGDTIRFEPDINKVVIFDQKSGRNVAIK